MHTIRHSTFLIFCVVISRGSITASLEEQNPIPEPVSDMPLEIQDEILDISESLNLTFPRTKVEEAVLVYRKVLAKEYLAFWEIQTNDNQYVILSARRYIGNSRLFAQGPLPTPTQQVNTAAAKLGESCTRYYMLNPEGSIFCKNEKGQIVAASTDVTGSVCNANSETEDCIRALTKLIEELMPLAEIDWLTHIERIEAGGREAETASVFDLVDGNKNSSQFESEEIVAEQALRPGEAVRVAIGEEYESILVTAVPHQPSTEGDLPTAQEVLCTKLLVDLCHEDGKVNREKIHTGDNGIPFIVIALSDDNVMIKEALHSNELSFRVEIKLKSGKLFVRRFGILLEGWAGVSDGNGEQDGPGDRQRSRRSRWTEVHWSEYKVYEIDKEYLFPRYWQTTHNGCQTGSAAVAWAMVFGYFDRLAHHLRVDSRLKNLWRSGKDGTTGSANTIAPELSNEQANRYIVKIRDALNSFCHNGQGVTRQYDMDGIKNFFRARGGRSVNLLRSSRYDLAGPITQFISDHVRNMFLATRKLPVIVGRRVTHHPSAQHYGVVTKYRQREKMTRTCTKFLFFNKHCWGWKTEYHRGFYVRMGYPHGEKDGWKDTDVFLAARALP
ncbi:uncharacterized protein [Ptychodera flava]|uniref:uncharacterized protein n=1 Tax=Ptychodera flava TaxID=63121 RepID=UPI003969C942